MLLTRAMVETEIRVAVGVTAMQLGAERIVG